MSKFLEKLKEKILVMDGAMGTQLMERGVRPEDCFEALNISRPEVVREIHLAYVRAGADIIETNTFGANSIKLADYGLADKVFEINVTAARLARQAIGDEGFVCGSIGPLGKMIDPLGEITFDQAVEVFAQQAQALEKGGVDVVSIETISDLSEMRAAVVAVKSNTKLPIIASMTYDENGKTVYGTPAEVAVVVLEALGVDIISANCSTGPEGLLKIAKKYLSETMLPVMVMPNAGMPELIDGRAVYRMTPKRFGDFAKKFAEMGVRIIGGCCGTGPEHIRAIKSKIQIPKFKINPKSQIPMTKFSSRTKVVGIKEGRPLLVGERINPSGRPLFQQEIREGKTQILRQEALVQTRAKADLLDVNVSVPETSESENMAKAVKVVQSVSDSPLAIDSPNRFALEEGLKHFCGKALLNSVNGKKESLENILPLAKKYGAAIIALALDEKGLPQTAEERVNIAEKIVRSAVELGIPKTDIFVDCLVLTAGVGMQGCL
ncbi:MAG: homocysteine S-methyltransferase family protein, partial [Candidatus Margulisiibacteriota bacterium]